MNRKAVILPKGEGEHIMKTSKATTTTPTLNSVTSIRLIAMAKLLSHEGYRAIDQQTLSTSLIKEAIVFLKEIVDFPNRINYLPV